MDIYEARQEIDRIDREISTLFCQRMQCSAAIGSYKLAQGLPIHVPENYFPNDDDTKEPIVRWRSHANLLFSNWLNYFVYQTTPYDIMSIGEK